MIGAFRFDEARDSLEEDQVCWSSDPLAILLAAEEDGETVLYHEHADDRVLN